VTSPSAGLKCSTERRFSISGNALGGLFAAGEILGGLYYHNLWRSRNRLVAGVVFGRLCWRGAARVARRNA
jgi:tricarballylate dehydrogenase